MSVVPRGRLDLTKLGRKSFLTASALSNLLQEIAEQDASFDPGPSSQQSIKRARVRSLNDTDSPHGPMMQEWNVAMSDGSIQTISFMNPATFLWESCRRSSKFREFLKARLEACPPSLERPWDLIWYNDEVSPGNQLAPTNRRKLQAVYYSFKQFGPEYLCQERSWFVLTACRSIVVQGMDAGMSQLTRLAMGSFMRFARGVVLPVGGDVFGVLVSKISLLVADEAALKAMLGNKGASGKLLCVLCRNTVQKRYAETLSGNLVYHAETDAAKFLIHSRASLLQCVGYLQEQQSKLGANAFAELQTALGINYFENGLLRDAKLMAEVDVCKALMYDWMHVFLVSGLFHKEMTLLLPLLRRSGITADMIHEFVSAFTWPLWTSTKGCTAGSLFFIQEIR